MEDFAHQAGHGGFASARVAGKDQVQHGRFQRLLTGFILSLLQGKPGRQLVDAFFDRL